MIPDFCPQTGMVCFNASPGTLWRAAVLRPRVGEPLLWMT